MTRLVWLRNDLRLRDNPALHLAASDGQGVVAVYVHCDAYVERFPLGPARLDFIRRHLLILRRGLASLNIGLKVIRVATPTQIAPCLLSLAQQQNAGHLFFNAEYPLDELNRDRSVKQLFSREGITVKRCHDRAVIPPGAIRNGQGEPYKVFTAFKKKWLQTATGLSLTPLGLPLKQPSNSKVESASDEEINALFSGCELRNLIHYWPAGEDEAAWRLADFIEQGIDTYHQRRDFPAIAGTSGLSPYLTTGSLSPRQVLSAVLAHTHGEWDRAGAQTWVNEIIWREFYQHVVVDFPKVCRREAMQSYTDGFPWRYDEDEFARWCQGRTGIPIVDAAMRQLNETGWMHNRLRMIVAMFLCKNLQIDWRLGETYFMQQLIDADFAANNGGWQWSASTGTDAAPYFRIFNPVSQSQRIDSEGRFIRKWVKELAHIHDKSIHFPQQVADYPPPSVDLAASRRSTIDIFSRLPRTP